MRAASVGLNSLPFFALIFAHANLTLPICETIEAKMRLPLDVNAP